MSDIATKLTYLNTTKTKIKDSINLTGAGITTEPFRQYAVKLKDAYVDIINNGTDTLYSNFPKVSGSGTDLSLTPTYEAPMQTTLNGNTYQKTTSIAQGDEYDSPSPDHPQDINVVSGNNTITISNSDNTETQTYPINLGSIELCKIGDYKDYFYKQDDKWYLHKEVGKVVLNGSESNNNFNTGKSGNFTRFGYLPFMNTSLVKVQSDYVSNYFKYLGTIGGDTTEAGISNTNVANLNRCFIFVPTSTASTISAFKTWLTTHNTSIYYVLATPTDTEITDTTLKVQLEDIYNAKSKNGTTNINQVNNDLPFNLTISALEKE